MRDCAAPEPVPGGDPAPADRLLGGRVVLWQGEAGRRAGSDAVLLAAAVPAEGGDRILELGSGNGAAALCLAWRVVAAEIVGLEIADDACALARRNVAANGFGGRVAILAGDIADPPPDLVARSFDQVMMNPPFFPRRLSSAPPDRARARARIADPGMLAGWLDLVHRLLRPRGRLTLILRVERLDEVLALLRPRFGGILVYPLWPRAGQPAKRFLLQATRGSGRPLRLLPGLVLHGAGNAYLPAAEAVLRQGAPLVLAAD